MAENGIKEELTEEELVNVSGGTGITMYKCSNKNCHYTCAENNLPQGGICPKCGGFLVEA